MSLYCSSCSNPVPEGLNQCRVCNRGFIPQLVCSGCSRVVERGAATCAYCPTSRQDYTSPTSVRQQSQAMMISRPEWERAQHREMVTTDYDAGRFGAISNVSVPENVADLMLDLQQEVRSLLALATKLAHYAQTEGSRHVIRQCRELATLLQEEFETRRGP